MVFELLYYIKFFGLICAFFNTLKDEDFKSRGINTSNANTHLKMICTKKLLLGKVEEGSLEMTLQHVIDFNLE